ncbi:hypothetical protein [Corynebacterium sp. HMSC074A01]|uniref:hypothetical protein n=1 Tax=Corynebacterium sp. HMSC074A01 TaxID=1715030 RepID=UPI00114CC60B|nr:hypothetical protein [Corynebacterium sp. HMSC074A01]
MANLEGNRRVNGAPLAILIVATVLVLALVGGPRPDPFDWLLLALFAAYAFFYARITLHVRVDDTALHLSLAGRETAIPLARITGVDEVGPQPSVWTWMFSPPHVSGPREVDGAECYSVGGPTVRINTLDGDYAVSVADPTTFAAALRERLNAARA